MEEVHRFRNGTVFLLCSLVFAARRFDVVFDGCARDGGAGGLLPVGFEQVGVEGEAGFFGGLGCHLWGLL